MASGRLLRQEFAQVAGGRRADLVAQHRGPAEQPAGRAQRLARTEPEVERLESLLVRVHEVSSLWSWAYRAFGMAWARKSYTARMRRLVRISRCTVSQIGSGAILIIGTIGT